MNQKGKIGKQPPKDDKLVDYKNLERNIVNEISSEFHTTENKKKNPNPKR